jgi:cellulose biosynthesis protein BcsQ
VILRLLRLRIVSRVGRDRKVARLERWVASLTSEKAQLKDQLFAMENTAKSAERSNGELTGRNHAQSETIAALSADCEQLKETHAALVTTAQRLSRLKNKEKRRADELSKQLDTIAVSDRRIWEVAVTGDASPFRSLSQRRTPIMALVNLKGGVGKTTITANLGVAMASHGWRVLLVDLDHQGSLSQLLLSGAEQKDLIDSRRLVDVAFADPSDGLAKFKSAIVRVRLVENGEISLVGADEALLDVETKLSQRWLARMTTDDVRYRLRAILHSESIADRFDFILLDCPPRLTTACINALAASDYVLVPVLPNATSTAAAPRLLKWLRHLRQFACPELAVMGVIGNKAKFYGGAPVKNQQAELKSLAGYCRDKWGSEITMFPALGVHDPLAQPLPALDSKMRGAYLELVTRLNKELPNYARCRSSRLSASVDPSVASVRG